MHLVNANFQYCYSVIDTAGQENFESTFDLVMRQAEGFLIVFSLADRNSLDTVRKFYQKES
jgi:GTPase SAR1 family protein